MKKLFKILSVVLLAGILTSQSLFGAGLISTNLSAGTNVIWTGRKSVYQVAIASATANLLNLYDTSSNALTYVVGSYTGSSNVPSLLITNLQTNAIFTYATSTQYLIQTNVSLSGAYRTNFTVPQTTNNVRAAATVYCPAGTVTSVDAVDLNFVNGITVTVTNSATVILYTRD